MHCKHCSGAPRTESVHSYCWMDHRNRRCTAHSACAHANLAGCRESGAGTSVEIRIDGSLLLKRAERSDTLILAGYCPVLVSKGNNPCRLQVFRHAPCRCLRRLNRNLPRLVPVFPPWSIWFCVCSSASAGEQEIGILSRRSFRLNGRRSVNCSAAVMLRVVPAGCLLNVRPGLRTVAVTGPYG